MKIRRPFLLILFLFLASLLTAQQSPDLLYGELFREVQMQKVFEDSKTFPDCIPLSTHEKILDDYERQKNAGSFNLKKFTLSHFQLPPVVDLHFRSDTSLSVSEHIEKLWPLLTRQGDTIRNSSLLPLPYPYIVPGGRFREIYYWDSYFTMLGLRESGKIDMMRHMVDNFTYLINTYGFIPNGNRSYYLSRSQPPYYSLMIELLKETTGENSNRDYLSALEKEYQFWMAGKDSLSKERECYRRIVRLPNGSILNRYWDDRPAPRPESYREDVTLCSLSSRPSEDLYRNIRAACESGWDFSSRWLKDEKSLLSIQTTDIIPVDLNCLLYHMEKNLAENYEFFGNIKMKNFYLKAATKRKSAILTYCWNSEQKFFNDYNFRIQQQTVIKSLAAVYPLFFKLCSKKQGEFVRKEIMQNFLKEGGLVTTLNHTGQQWDAPNGWAPLHYICSEAFMQYGFREDAALISNKWKVLNIKIFKSSGKMLEKYNVFQTDLKGGGGEYPLQDGFGWTNGVFLYFFR